MPNRAAGSSSTIRTTGFIIEQTDEQLSWRLDRYVQDTSRFLFLTPLSLRFCAFIAIELRGIVFFEWVDLLCVRIIFPLRDQQQLLPILVAECYLPPWRLRPGKELLWRRFPSDRCDVVRTHLLFIMVHHFPQRFGRQLFVHFWLHRFNLLDDLFSFRSCFRNPVLDRSNLWILLSLCHWARLVVTGD